MIFTVFKKEMIDTLRDRRTLYTMILIPILVFPLILYISSAISAFTAEKAMNKIAKVGIIDKEGTFKNELTALPVKDWKMKFTAYSDSAAMKKAINDKTCDFGFFVPSSYTSNLSALQTGTIDVYFKASELGFEERSKNVIEHFSKIELTKRLAIMKISPAQILPLSARYNNIASDQEMIGKLVGGMLPYMFILFGFIGCMYPAIDLFTGEKERGTIETLLTTPIKRWQILLGKMMVVAVSGVASAAFALIGLGITILLMDKMGLPEEMSNAVKSIVTVEFIIVLIFMLIPLMIFFAGILIPIAIYAKSFKEAQSLIAPLNMAIILPALVGLMPGIEYNLMTACIPIVNIVLATKELIAGTLNYGLLALSFAVMSILAISVVAYCQKQYSKETNII
jgi:sodium transport system permease protein